MLKRYLLLALSLLTGIFAQAQVTLEQCIALARDNYPLIRRYGLVSRTKAVNLSDINKSWLPQISVYGQGSVQSDVPAFPDALSSIISQAGISVPGLGEWQYKVGADISQTIWDGGEAKARRMVERSLDVERRAAVEVGLYAVRERVEELFFGILLLDEQARQTQVTLSRLHANLKKLEAMLKNGTAMQGDVDLVKAQCLSVKQQLTQAESASGSYRKLLGTFIGKSLDGQELARPDAAMPKDLGTDRPELWRFDAQLRTIDARKASVTSSTMPKIGLFAQAYYGYPGLDYFESMMHRDPSFNAIAGIRVSWNIGELYWKKNRQRKLRLASEDISVDRDVFLFNNSLEVQSRLDRIDELKAIMEDDGKIMELRANVRKAAESQLDNGVIDGTELVTRLADELTARRNAAFHEIQLLQSIYQLKHTLNR